MYARILRALCFCVGLLHSVFVNAAVGDTYTNPLAGGVYGTKESACQAALSHAQEVWTTTAWGAFQSASLYSAASDGNCTYTVVFANRTFQGEAMILNTVASRWVFDHSCHLGEYASITKNTSDGNGSSDFTPPDTCYQACKVNWNSVPSQEWYQTVSPYKSWAMYEGARTGDTCDSPPGSQESDVSAPSPTAPNTAPCVGNACATAGTTGGGTTGGGTTGGGTTGGGTTGGGTTGGGTTGGGTTGGGTTGGGTTGGGTTGGGTTGGGTTGGGTTGGTTGGGSTGSNGTSNPSSNCENPPACTGDGVLCGIMRQQWETDCLIHKDLSTIDQGTKDKLDKLSDTNLIRNDPDVLTSHAGLQTELQNLRSYLNFSSGSCAPDYTFYAMGRAVTLPLSRLCTLFRLLALCLHFFVLWVSLAIVFRSITNNPIGGRFA